MKVPGYDAPQVASTPLPGVREQSIASADLMGGVEAKQQQQVGAGMFAGGTLISDIATKLQERENADVVFRTEAAIKNEYIEFEKSVRTRKGQNAWGVTDETKKWWDDAYKKHAEGLGNDTQRRVFDQTATKLRTASLSSVAGYEAGQREASLEASASASIVGSTNFAAANFDNPTTVAESKTDVIKRSAALSQLKGDPPELRAAREAEHLTNFHKQVLQAMVEKDPTGAKAYYEANKGEINGGARDTIEKAVNEGALREVAQKATDDVMAKGLPMAEALTLVRNTYKGKDEDEISRRVKERYGEAAAAQQQDQRAAGDAAWKVITSGGGRKNIPVETWQRLGGEEQRQILDYLDAKSRRGAGEGQDDIANLATVERMIEQGDITDKAQLARYAPYFKPSTLKTLGVKIDKRGEVSPTEVRRVFEDRLGKPRSRWNDAEREQWMAFQNYILTNVKETKRPEDIDTWGDRWFMKGGGKNDSFFTNDPDTYGEAITKGRKDFVITAPDSAKPMAQGALSLMRKAGVKVPTKGGVDEFYTQYQLDAERWLAARNMPTSEAAVAAYAMLKGANKPITAANIEHVAKQLK